MDVPIVVVSYNNHKYVENTLKQIFSLNENYYKNIVIMDNCSNDPKTIEYLNAVDVKVIRNSTNDGPWINDLKNAGVYNSLPEKFILTDPDLELNPLLPRNFIDILVELSNKYQCTKVGFALDISNFDEMYQFEYHVGKTIYEWEKQFWENKIDDNEYELYRASIDTTFCLVNKRFRMGEIRVAGNFTAKHLPWYKNNKILSPSEVYNQALNTSLISTLSRVLLPHIDSNYSKIETDGEIRLFKKDS